jgi:hypothetical protein
MKSSSGVSSSAAGVLKDVTNNTETTAGRQTVDDTLKTTASRKRDRICTVSSSIDDTSENLSNGFEDDMPDAAAEFWRRKFDALNHQRTLEVAELANQLEATTAREKKLEDYVKLLTKKLNLTEKKLSRGHKGSNQEVLDFFQKITSLTIESIKIVDADELYTCLVTNTQLEKSCRFQFKLTAEEAHFMPLTQTDLLPEYLRNHISFDKEMLPVVLGDVLQNLFEDDEVTNGH